MPRAPVIFTQALVLRAWAAARKDGKEVVETRIGADGSIALVHRANGVLHVPKTTYDTWKTSDGSR